MKKKIWAAFGIISALFFVLFIVQIVDEKVNGDDYKKIHSFGHNINSLIQNDQKCKNNLDKILVSIVENKQDIQAKVLDEKIVACQTLSNEIKSVKIPEIKNKNKMMQMQKAKNAFAESYLTFVDIIEKYKKGMENNEYHFSILKKYTDLSKEILIYSLEIHLTYSIKDILLTRPLILYLKIKT